VFLPVFLSVHVFWDCVFLLNVCLCLGLCESGLFRVGGEVKLCHELRKSFDQGSFPDLDSVNIPTTASLFKHFLRELPGGLIPDSHRTRLLKVFKGRW